MAETGTMRVKSGLAEMLKGGVIMDVVDAEQAKIAEEAGACAVMALERVPADIRRDGGVARMSDPEMISRIFVTGAMRATPPSARMSAGTRSSAITAQAPESSAIRAWSASVTSMITPPLSISARPLLTRIVPYSAMERLYLELPLRTGLLFDRFG